MRTWRAIAVAVAAAVGSAEGAEVQARSFTLLGLRPDVRSGEVTSVVPLTEWVGLTARNIENPFSADLSLVLDAWAQLRAEPERASANGDVNLAYLEARFFQRKLRLRLGRQVALGGAARFTHLDGAWLEYRGGPGGFGLSAFGGVPVLRRFQAYVQGGDWTVGTRAFWAPSYDAELGVSFVQVAARHLVLTRQDVGADFRWRPTRFLTAAGAFVYSLGEKRMAELDLGTRFQPVDALELELSYRRTSPDLFLPRDSVLTVFAENERDDVGLSALWQATRAFSVFAEGRVLWVQGEAGLDVGVRGQLRPYRHSGTTLTAQFRRLQVPVNAYSQGRLGARHTVPGGVGLAVDVDVYSLDRPVRGQRLSVTGSATLTWRPAAAWLLGATFLGATTPTFERRYEGMLKVSYAPLEDTL